MHFDLSLEQLLANPVLLWAIVASVLVVIELTIVGIGIGLLFLGLGAYLTAVILWLGFIEPNNYIAQFSSFFLGSAFFTAILWKPLKKLKNSSKESYHDMIGQYATVIQSPLLQNKKGTVKWSGSVMKARIAADSENTEFAIDTEVIIKDVKGSTVFVDTK